MKIKIDGKEYDFRMKGTVGLVYLAERMLGEPLKDGDKYHTLVLYYLLQPYNVGLESRSHAYSIVNTATYAVCYFTMNLELPTVIFGLCVIGFCVVYIAAALVLAYRLAPKTFKLRT